jgi:hypothetical protein
MKNFAYSQNKFDLVYLLTTTGMAKKLALTHLFLRRNMDEYEAFNTESKTLISEVREGQVDSPRKLAK